MPDVFADSEAFDSWFNLDDVVSSDSDVRAQHTAANASTSDATVAATDAGVESAAAPAPAVAAQASLVSQLHRVLRPFMVRVIFDLLSRACDSTCTVTWQQRPVLRFRCCSFGDSSPTLPSRSRPRRRHCSTLVSARCSVSCTSHSCYAMCRPCLQVVALAQALRPSPLVASATC